MKTTKVTQKVSGLRIEEEIYSRFEAGTLTTEP
jgi:hypothetical protein